MPHSAHAVVFVNLNPDVARLTEVSEMFIDLIKMVYNCDSLDDSTRTAQAYIQRNAR